jgi:hypothetical protein
MLTMLIDETTRQCEDALLQPGVAQAMHALEQCGVAKAEILRAVQAVTPLSESHAAVRDLSARVASYGAAIDSASVERGLILTTAIESLALLPAVPVCDAVKALFCEEVGSWTSLDEEGADEFHIGTGRFEAACKTASLRRFPAGQFDWEVGGLPFSYLLRVTPRSLPRALYVAAARLKGRRPVFFAHLGYRRRGESLSEVEANKSYYRMARSLERQPSVKGFVASSWLRSPDTGKVSPHLAWLNRVFLENGGFVAVMGPADPGSGVLLRSETRRRLYERGEFKPTIGLVMWPRQAMIRWARQHPELDDQRGSA